MPNKLRLAIAGLYLTTLSLAGTTTPAAANCPSFEEMEARQARLENRIVEGLKSGKLTDKQAKRYRKILSEVAARESRCRAGRHLSQFEANQLNLDLDYVSRCISHALKSKQTASSTEHAESPTENSSTSQPPADQTVTERPAK